VTGAHAGASLQDQRLKEPRMVILLPAQLGPGRAQDNASAIDDFDVPRLAQVASLQQAHEFRGVQVQGDQHHPDHDAIAGHDRHVHRDGRGGRAEGERARHLGQTLVKGVVHAV